MIVDQLERLSCYSSISSHIKDICHFLEVFEWDKNEKEKIEITDELFVLVQEYETKEENHLPEWHEKYLDLQFIVEGDETIQVGSMNQLEILEDYNAETDIGFVQFSKKPINVDLYTGDFVLIFPWEAHAPCIRMKSERVKKLVFKIKKEEYHA